MNFRRPPWEIAEGVCARICLPSDIRVMRSSKRRESRDLPELQSRHEGTQRAHLSQEAKMAVPEVQAGANAGTEAASVVRLAKDRNGETLSKDSAHHGRILWQPIRSPNGYPASMDINKMLVELRAERDQLAEAILVLERLAIGRAKRRGRPPAWMTAVRRGRPPGSKNRPKEA